MNSSFWFLARKSGFAFWEKEDWNPTNAMIDWSCDYDTEIQRYTKEVVLHTIEYMNRNYYTVGTDTVDDILIDFGIKNEH